MFGKIANDRIIISMTTEMIVDEILTGIVIQVIVPIYTLILKREAFKRLLLGNNKRNNKQSMIEQRKESYFFPIDTKYL